MIQIITLAVICVLVAIDQVTKYFVTANLAVGESCFKIPHFSEIHYVRNYGGMMGSFDGMGKVLGIVTILLLVVGIGALLMKKIKFGVPYICITAIIAGGIGNLIDRIRLGYVIDFINVLFVKFYVFNFADCLVTCGAFALVFYEIYLAVKEAREKGDTNA